MKAISCINRMKKNCGEIDRHILDGMESGMSFVCNNPQSKK